MSRSHAFTPCEELRICTLFGGGRVLFYNDRPDGEYRTERIVPRSKYMNRARAMPIGTRQTMKSAESDISDGTKTYLENLVGGLRQEITELRSLIQEKNERINTLEVNLEVSVTRINSLEENVVESVRRNILLASKISELEESVNVRLDDGEQYSRKDSLRIEGIEYTSGETNASLKAVVIKSLNNLGAKVSQTDIFRLHRSSKPRTLTNGLTIAQTIVKFTNWSARSKAYGTRFGSWEERKKRPVYVNVDRTKRRLGLLARARDALKDHSHAHAYANGECRLIVRNRAEKKDHPFNTNAELDGILSSL